MILYRVTRYGKNGRVKWVRYKTTKHTFGAAKGDIGGSFMGYKYDRVTLEEITIPDENIKLVEDFSLSAEELARLEERGY